MAKRYYHNISKHQLNETEIVDLIDNYDENDLIYFSEAGNACLELLSKEDLGAIKLRVKEFYEDD